jgi:hypothetical protein
MPFYLTGGTALGRFYLNHRFSEDLDFFMNADSQYPEWIGELKNKLPCSFKTDSKLSIFTDDLTRFFITENDLLLKIDFVNDVHYYAGNQADYQYGKIDTPLNILANKLTAIIGRDEPKDIFDIIYISLNYAFSWPEIFFHAKEKAVLNEIDIEERMISFPIEFLKNVNWFITPFNSEVMGRILRQIADDFLLGRENSLGSHKTPIESARPVLLG